MVISAETPPRPPDSAAASSSVAASAAATETMPPRGETQGTLLHNFSFPILKTWGSHRVLRCMSVNGKGEAVAGGGRRSAALVAPAGPPIRAGEESGGGDDPGIEEVREKLLAHLREAADRMKLVVPLLPKYGGSEALPKPAPEARLDTGTDTLAAPAADRMKLVVPLLPKCGGSEALPKPKPAPEARLDTGTDTLAAPAARPWNLRTRRGAARAPEGIERHLSESPPGVAEKRTVRLRSGDPERRDRPKFSISLTKEEIEEDIYAVTGCRARRRPRKRARAVQKQLDALFPGSWLSEITADSYRVPD